MPRYIALALSLSLAAHASLAVVGARRAQLAQPESAPATRAASEPELLFEVLSEPELIASGGSPRQVAPQPARLPTHEVQALHSLAPAPIAPSLPVANASALVASNESSAASAAEQPPAPRFTLQVAAVTSLASVPSAGQATHGAGQPEGGDAPLGEGLVDKPATLLSGAPPAYTAAAEAAGIETELPLEVVIDRTGSVQSARALAHTGYGLDEAALSAVRRYRFTPARRANRIVAVRMRWLMRFQLR